MPDVPTLTDLRMTHDPQRRGYCAVYREHEVNHCPGCGRTHWIIGRSTAECAFCATALPLALSLTGGTPAVIRHRNARPSPAWAA